MRPSSRLPALALLVVATVSPTLLPRSAAGDAITYTTTGTVWPWAYGNGAVSAVAGTPVIHFQGITDGTFLAPGAFPLGTFVVDPLPSGTSTTYHDTAFSIALTTSTGGPVAFLDPSIPSIPYSQFAITGVLNGTVEGDGRSDVVVTVRTVLPETFVSVPEAHPVPIFDPPFPASSLNLIAPIVLASSPDGGQTTLLAHVTAVPEPSPAAILAAAAAGLAWIRRPRAGLRRGRPESSPRARPARIRASAAPPVDPTLFPGD